MNVIINYQQCAIRFSTRPSDEVLRGLRAEGFTWHAPTFSWIRPEGWNGLPEDFCDWLVSTADPAPVELEPRPPTSRPPWITTAC